MPAALTVSLPDFLRSGSSRLRNIFGGLFRRLGFFVFQSFDEGINIALLHFFLPRGLSTNDFISCRHFPALASMAMKLRIDVVVLATGGSEK